MDFKFNSEIEKKVKDIISKNIEITKWVFYHGTFASKDIKMITDVDITQYYEVKEEDVLDRDALNKKKRKEVLKIIQDNLKNIKKKKNLIFNELMSGYDERFLFRFNITKDGKVMNFKADEIRERFKKLLKEKVITKDEYKALHSKVKNNPSLEEFYIFYFELENYYPITWTYDEIMKGSKIIRNKTFHLEETFRNYYNTFVFVQNPIVFTFVMLIGDIYLDVDSTLILFFKNNSNFKIGNIQDFETRSKNMRFINEKDREKSLKLYHGIFQNLYKGKYFKMFKRLRTILGKLVFDNHNINNKTKNIFKNIRFEMKKVINDDYTLLNQYKNRIESLLFLKDHLPNTHMLKLVTSMLETLSKFIFIDDALIEGIVKNKKIDYVKLKALQKEIFNYLNHKTKNIFIDFYRRSKKFIDFDVKELNELKPDKELDFSSHLSCDSFYRNLIPNEKYKYFRSYFEYALDWDQCKKLIPMDEEPVRNMLNYLFHKFKSGTFVQIKDNKVYKFVPFYNLHFKNNWAHKIKTNSKKLNSKRMKRFEHDKSKWTMLNCVVKVNDLNDTGENRKFELKDMLDYTLNNNVVKDCSFFINDKDFPLLSKNKFEPYEYLWGDKVPLTSYDYDEYTPLFSFVNKNNEFFDEYLPTDNCWQFITKGYFPPTCDNDFDDDGKRTNWSKKKDTVMWRGSTTGCHMDLRNPRILISKINKEWSEDPKLKGFLDAGVTKETFKFKIDDGELKKTNLHQLGIRTLNKLSMTEQFEYKYLLDIEGNSAAYRLGYFLSSKSTLFKVDSPYTIWINEFLKPKEDYLPVKRDFSDLSITVEWARKHDKACKKIGENAYKIYKNCYTKEFIGKYIASKLNNLKTIKF